ncbi:hypothetical protein D9Q98_010039 [Chlorella vulgaris]|uniref:BSD domain-containing protein n=1 Tax=Chlorella vulgaris TaxID=3077 RepID=A0A9D4TMN3_CHLVU|nr:hypothetical protein D9Q98_010039 [Chlorella vulgaris]
MDFWKNMQVAAEKAASVAKDFGKKGLEAVEATAEEASKKLNLNLHDKVGAGPATQNALPQAELEAFGITPEFGEFVRTLNYSAFRDFPTERLLPAADGGAAAGNTAAAVSPAYQLNPWQVRHATLVVQALKEVNELRFVLCPKYMTDEHFWHVYFTLARKYLPDKAFSWSATDVLPSFGPSADQSDDVFSLTGMGKELLRLGSQLQQGASSAVGASGLELTKLVSGSGGSSSAASTTQPGAGSTGAGGGVVQPGGAAAAARAGPASGMLEEDPDLEAYLQVAISNSQPGSNEGEEGSGYDVASGVGEGEDEDLDLDSYINELTEEVEAAAAAEKESEAAAAAGSSGGTEAKG